MQEHVTQQELVKRRKNVIKNLMGRQTNINMRREDFADPTRPLKDKEAERQIQRKVAQIDAQERQKMVDRCFEKIVISGFVNPELMSRRMLKIKNSAKQLKFLYIEIDYIENLEQQGYLLNDFIFNVCVLKHFPFGEEPFFLPGDVRILIEVSPYLGNVLYDQIVNLKLFDRRHLAFDLGRFDLNAHCEFEEDARVLAEFYSENIKSGAVERREYLNATRFLIPLPGAGDKIESSHKKRLLGSQQREHVVEAFEQLFVAEAKKNGFSPSFALLKLFTKIVSHELRNLNSNSIYDQSEDYRRLKLGVMPLIARLVCRNIQPSVQSRSKQEQANKTNFDQEDR